MVEKVILIEQARGCGYRKPGKGGVGLYLMGDGLPEPCERLPWPLTVCPCCGAGIKFSRAWTWIHLASLMPTSTEPKCILWDLQVRAKAPDEWTEAEAEAVARHHHHQCPCCSPDRAEPRAGLLWIGQNHYTPQAFIREALERGISRKLPSIPRGFEPGKTWVLLAHKRALLGQDEQGKPTASPAIFYAYKPTHFDLVVADIEKIPDTAHRLAEALGEGNARIVQVVRDIGQPALFEGGEP